jgi:outer membrane receptor for ferrienterochelin and colicins
VPIIETRWSRALTAVLFASLASALPSRSVGGQPASDLISGRVLDAATGRALAGAEVRLVGRDSTHTRTGTNGEWTLRTPAPGSYVMRVRLLGYLPADKKVEVERGATVVAAVRLEAAPLALDQIVVTAARREQALADAVTTTEIVSRADIDRSGATDLASVLTEQTGVELQGGHPAGAGVMLQGIGSERVLVLLDGQPIAGRISGVFDISRIPTAIVDRVEMVKGAQSTLYGSEAMGGVVNIITRTPARGLIGADFRAIAGTQDRRDLTASLNGGIGRVSSAIDVSRRNIEMTPGVGASAGALASRLDGAAKLRWTHDSTRWIESSVLALDERQRWRTGTFHNFADNRQLNARIGAATEWGGGRHRFTPSFFASVFDHLSRASRETKPIAGDTGQRQLQRIYQTELLYGTRFGRTRSQLLDAGLLVRRDETETERVPGGLRSITNVEPYAQLELTAAAGLAIVPGLRVSRSSEWGTHVTPRLAARYRANERLTFRGSVGEGYRAPDFKELFMFFQNTSAGYAVHGNPDLVPETSRNVTAGVEWASDAAYARAQLFHNEFRDFIETRPISEAGEAPVYEYANVDNGFTRGVELESGLSLGGVRMEAAYSGLATRDDATGRALLGRSTHAGRASLGATLPLALRVTVSGIYTGRTPMERDPATGTITSWRDAYLRTDVRVARALFRAFADTELVVGADNLFDTRPAQWAGFTGRHVYTALSWTISRDTSR